MDEALAKQLKKELKVHARAIGVPEGAAKAFIEQTILGAQKNLTAKTTITSQDLTRLVSKELAKYSSDLAYAYKNHDKII